MLKTAKKYKASFAAIKLDRHLKEQLPIWYHISATKELRRLDNTSLSKCLRRVHNVKTVADIARATRHDALIQTNEGEADEKCPCDQCEMDRQMGCKDPLRCRDAAGRLLNRLEQKWNPAERSPNDGLTLTTKKLKENMEALDKDKAATFNPSVTERGGLSEAFRVFVDNENIDNPPAVRPRRGISIEPERVSAY
ncbi:uncharacterized protein C8Q71DRAFT_681820, partial [Rhodofomes roseus]